MEYRKADDKVCLRGENQLIFLSLVYRWNIIPKAKQKLRGRMGSHSGKIAWVLRTPMLPTDIFKKFSKAEALDLFVADVRPSEVMLANTKDSEV